MSDNVNGNGHAVGSPARRSASRVRGKPKPATPAKTDRKPPSVTLDRKGGTLTIGLEGDFFRIIDATGRHPAVSGGLLNQIAALGSPGRRSDDTASNFAVGFIDAMAPQDAVESLLLAQMAATHQAAMIFARRLNHVENIPQQDSAERAFNKLVRSYASQVEALKRYRSKGQQVVRVERVTVESGAQAVVGNVSHGGRGEK